MTLSIYYDVVTVIFVVCVTFVIPCHIILFLLRFKIRDEEKKRKKIVKSK